MELSGTMKPPPGKKDHGIMNSPLGTNSTMISRNCLWERIVNVSKACLSTITPRLHDRILVVSRYVLTYRKRHMTCKRGCIFYTCADKFNLCIEVIFYTCADIFYPCIRVIYYTCTVKVVIITNLEQKQKSA